MDPCGQAGGKYKQTPVGGDSVFATVSLDGKTYQMGDLGSKVLPPNHPSDAANWTVGSTPRVAWGMRFNHGGGYQYRLCPLEKMPCTEKDFQKMPLDFVRNAHAIVSIIKYLYVCTSSLKKYFQNNFYFCPQSNNCSDITLACV